MTAATWSGAPSASKFGYAPSRTSAEAFAGWQRARQRWPRRGGPGPSGARCASHGGGSRRLNLWRRSMRLTGGRSSGSLRRQHRGEHMASAPRRDTEQFCDFVVSRSGALFRVAYLMLGDHQLAEDLVQESLEKTYVAWPRLREVANAEAYTRRVIATTAISWRRRRSFHERPAEHLPEPCGEDLSATVVLHDALWAHLQALPPRQRAAVVLRHYADLSEAQTAEAMGCSIGTVKSSVSAGLQRLRQRVGPDLVLLPPDDQAVAP